MISASSEAFHHLVVRHLAGETTPAEEQTLAEFIKQPAYRAVYDELAQAWGQANARPNTEFNVEEAVSRLRREVAHENRQAADRRELAEKKPGAGFAFWRHGLWGTAAAAGLVVAISLIWSQRLPATSEWAEARTAPGERRAVVLPDGTRVQLNALSTLGFPSAFAETERRVVLSGEGFFEVTTDAQKPFVVETAALTVAGPEGRFNLSAYDDDADVTVAVLSGGLRVTPAATKGGGPVEVSGAQSYVWSRAEPTGRVQVIDEPRVVGWRSNQLIFRDASAGEVAKRIARKFGVPVEVVTTFPAEEKVTAHFTHESLEEICAALELTGGMVCQIERSDGVITHVRLLRPSR